ncbi:FAD-binding and (Fe-S)-binding domain-containing protein [Yinghuangia aomiensis]|uniref:D-lactate dehydrogenase (cytochrome) n=1 Tax=Yinghuangia aomiensis TaxID=676205 RepID=A0ABP9I8Z3_9ACTN
MNPTDTDAPATLLAPIDQDLVAALEIARVGTVAARPSDRLAHAHDASHYLLTPQAIVRPSDTADMSRLARFATSHAMPLAFRSGGTSLSGQAGTEHLLVDTRRHFRRVDILDDGLRARVQPGATVRGVNARLARHHRKLGPDPASEIACTIGGVVANNSSGMTCGTTHNTYRTLESAVLVLASGNVIDTARPDADDELARLQPELHAGLTLLRDRVRADPDSMDRIARLYAIKNTMGYGLNSFVDHDSAVDILLRLVIGSEGTLAFVAEATFRTVPLPTHFATGLLLFDGLEAATAALPELIDAGFAAIELMDATSLRVAQRDPEAPSSLRALTVADHAALLVEFQEFDDIGLDAREDGSTHLWSKFPLVSPVELTRDASARGQLWHVRKGLYALVAGDRPRGTTALLEDIAVPPDRLLPTCRALTGLFVAHAYQDCAIFGHAKDGNIHFMLTERFDDSANLDRYLAFTEDMVDLVLAQGGTLKAEHGTGRMMAPYLARQYGDELHAVMREIKRLADPDGILNPGVLIAEDSRAHVRNLKSTPPVEAEVDQCVECGYCEPGCPSKDLTTTPRQRIVLRREIERAHIGGDHALARALEDDYAYDAIDTCAVDGMCETACPVLINTGDLVRRLRTDRRTTAERATWTFAAKHWGGTTRTMSAALKVAAALPDGVASAATRAARALLGADAVPLWTPDLPRGGGPMAAPAPHDADVVYFPSCVSAMFAPARGGNGVRSAFLSLCESAGLKVAVPPRTGSTCCGTPWKSKGLSDGYREMRVRVEHLLMEATTGGRLPVVCDASSCTEGLLALELSAQGTPLTIIDAVDFVDRVLLPELPPVSKVPDIVVHATCATTRLGITGALLRVAAAAADTVHVPDDWGCCGFAGDRGMLHPELTASATRRQAQRLPEADEFVSANRTCEIGMTRATGHPYRHVLEVLASGVRAAASEAGQ